MKATNYRHTSLTYRTWDEGMDGDPLFVYVESLGPVGVVRASSWEEAYECVVDEIMDDADPEDEDSYARSYDETADEGELAEGVHYRNNGVPANDGLDSHLAREDLNGAKLHQTTIDELRETYGIVVTWEDE